MKQKKQADLVEEIRERVNLSSQRAVAVELGISLAMVNDLLRGRRDISEAMARKLGYQREVIFTKVA